MPFAAFSVSSVAVAVVLATFLTLLVPSSCLALLRSTSLPRTRARTVPLPPTAALADGEQRPAQAAFDLEPRDHPLLLQWTVQKTGEC